MDLHNTGLKDFSEFISSPQGEGVWSMRVELSEPQMATLTSFLNLEGHMRYRAGGYGLYSFRKYSPYSYDEGPPVILPRLLAYMRSAISQRERNELVELTIKDESQRTNTRLFQQRRSYRLINDILTPPTRLSASKRIRLRKAWGIYREHFERCQIIPVAEDISKVDLVSHRPLTYVQIAEEGSIIRISSPSEESLQRLRQVLSAVLKDDIQMELTKIFSPESSVMAMYLPILQVIPYQSVLQDKAAILNVRQALVEVREQRFIHAIRAIGIAAEELLVGIYETYLREKAPEAPLGSLINELSEKVQEVVQGARPSKEVSLGVARKHIGKAIEAEKQTSKNANFLLLAEQIQQSIIPILENLKQTIDEHTSQTLKTQKINLFPLNVKRCLSELVNLRNRVSHRVERAVSVASVGYLDTAIALRDFIVIARWWERERKQLNYKSTPKVMIQDTVRRSKSQEADTEK
jgi:hypothetical protein